MTSGILGNVGTTCPLALTRKEFVARNYARNMNKNKKNNEDEDEEEEEGEGCYDDDFAALARSF